jgi:hypothetical protein
MNSENEYGMPNPGEEMEARLWAYIDGLSEPGEHSTIERLIAEQAEWRMRYEELFALHRSIGEIELEEPSLRFTKNVMEEIARLQIAPAAKNYINSRVIWGIALFFIVTFVGFLVYGFGQIDWSAASDSQSALSIDLQKVDYSKMFGNNLVNIMMMLNVILALMFLDRYLANQKRKHRVSGVNGQ